MATPYSDGINLSGRKKVYPGVTNTGTRSTNTSGSTINYTSALTSGTGTDTGTVTNTGTGYVTPPAINIYKAQLESGISNNNNMFKSYEEFLLAQKDGTTAEAKATREEAERRAAVERERAIVDASTSYQQNKATYGANAEALGRMGLTGSGYGDYINSQAYAQQRSDTQTANAQALATSNAARYSEEEAIRQANSDYQNGLFGVKQDVDSKNDELEKNYQNYLMELQQNAEYDGDILLDMQTRIASGAMTPEEGRSYLYDNYNSGIEAGVVSLDEIENAYKNKYLTEEQYNNLSATYKKLYSPSSTMGTTDAKTSELGSKGNNYKVVIGNEKFKVQSGGESTDESVKSAAKGLSNGAVFGYKNNLYVVHSGKVYNIESRALNSEGYEKLYEKIFGNIN